MTQTMVEEYECPACKGTVEPDWSACPHCGVVYEAADDPPPASAKGNGRAAVAEETEQIAYIGVPGGAKRPITVTSELQVSVTTPGPPLRSLLTTRPELERIPPEPPSEDSHKRVTVVAETEEALELPSPPPPAAVSAPPLKIVEASPPATTVVEAPAPPSAANADLAAAMRAAPPPEPIVAADPSPATALAPTVVVVAPQPQAPARRLPEDLAELEHIIDAAVAKAFREYGTHVVLAQPPQTTTVQSTAVVQGARRGRLAGAGVGLLLGGAVGDLVILNWDTWIRGDAGAAIGWIQQTGIIGMAAFIGAGAAVGLLGLSRNWLRSARAH